MKINSLINRETMKAKNKITGIEFVRKLQSQSSIVKHQVIIYLENEIPSLAYGSKEIIKLLKKYN